MDSKHLKCGSRKGRCPKEFNEYGGEGILVQLKPREKSERMKMTTIEC